MKLSTASSGASIGIFRNVNPKKVDLMSSFCVSRKEKMNRKIFLYFTLIFLGLLICIILLINVQAQAPQQTQIAFDSMEEDTVSEIYVMDVDGENQRKLTNNIEGVKFAFDPTQSLDGQKIAFTALTNKNTEIYVIDANGKNPRNLTNHPADDLFPAWSPDSKWIAFSSNRDGNSEIYVTNINGNNLRNLTNNPSSESSPSWSPDGQWIAFQFNRGDGNAEIYIMDADGKNSKNLTNHPAVDVTPVWSPDGKWIAFTSVRDGNSEIYVMDVNGKKLRNLTNHPAADRNPDWFDPAFALRPVSPSGNVKAIWGYLKQTTK